MARKTTFPVPDRMVVVPPLKAQVDYLKAAKGKSGFANHCEQGTGKTKGLLDEAAVLFRQGEIDRVVVVAPKGVHLNWAMLEIPKNYREGSFKALALRSSPSARAVTRLKEMGRERGGDKLRFACINYDALTASAKLMALLRAFMLSGQALLIVDESHKIRTPSAARTRRVLTLGAYAVYRRTATGTPANNPFHLWAQMNFLDPRILNEPSYVAHKARYGVMLDSKSGLIQHIVKKQMGELLARGIPEEKAMKMIASRTPQIQQKNPDGSPKFRDMDRLAKIIAPYVFRRTKAECLDLPDKLYRRRLYEPSPQQRRLYNDIIQELRIYWQGEVSSLTKLSSLIRLRQVLSSALIPETGRTPVRLKENPKMEALIEEVEELGDGEQFIVYACYTFELKDIQLRLLESLGIKSEIYNGEVSAIKRKDIERRFQSHALRAIIVQVQTGIGWTGTAASHVFYYSCDFSYDNRYQSEDRAHRIGQTKNVTYTDIIAPSSIEERILNIIQSKRNVADILNGDDGGRGLLSTMDMEEGEL